MICRTSYETYKYCKINRDDKFYYIIKLQEGILSLSEELHRIRLHSITTETEANLYLDYFLGAKLKYGEHMTSIKIS